MWLVNKALEFATKAHEGQVRKYTGEAYINHPIEVMNIVKTVAHSETMLAAALLHDCVEDCDVRLAEIFDLFGSRVAAHVDDLTDESNPEDGNRATRKEIDRNHTEVGLADSKTIKLADLISNSRSIVEHDKEFAKVYIKEKELLLEVLTEGDQTLWNIAKDIVEKAKKELNIE